MYAYRNLALCIPFAGTLPRADAPVQQQATKLERISLNELRRFVSSGREITNPSVRGQDLATVLNSFERRHHYAAKVKEIH